MSPAYRVVVVLVVLTAAAAAGTGVSRPSCSADVCVLSVTAPDLVSAPCVGYSVLIAYSQTSGASLIQCSKPGRPEANRSFIYDRHDRQLKPFEFTGSRFIRPDSFAEIKEDGVPDRFGHVPLCPAKVRKTPLNGELLIIEKQPNSQGSAPYCYRINYVEAGQGALKIVSDQGKELPPAPDKSAMTWAKLVEKLSAYIAQP